MENDAIILETLELPKNPLSAVYNVLDWFNPENILSKTPCTER